MKQVKYLETVLDSKLSRRSKVEERVVNFALYAMQKMQNVLKSRESL